MFLTILLGSFGLLLLLLIWAAHALRRATHRLSRESGAPLSSGSRFDLICAILTYNPEYQI